MRNINSKILDDSMFVEECYVKIYTALYHRIEKDIFTEEITNRIIEYANTASRNADDLLLISHTTGIKK